MEITLDQIEEVKTKVDCSYKEAKEALEKENGVVSDAINYIEEIKIERHNNKISTKMHLDTIAEAAEKVGDTIKGVGEKIMDTEAAKVSKEKIGGVGAELFNTRILNSSIDEYVPIWAEYDKESVVLELSCAKLFKERKISILEISKVEALINSIANTPKSFNNDFKEIRVEIEQFESAMIVEEERLEELKKSVGKAGAGTAVGIGVVALAPSAAIAVATTFGTASTGTAISALSGAAATNAAVAWLGGGATVAGGGGMAAGNALLALAGPIGWSIAGASIIGSGVFMSFGNKKKAAQIHETTIVLSERLSENKIIQLEIDKLIEATLDLKENISKNCTQLMDFFGNDYLKMDNETQLRFGTLVNTTRALAVHINSTIEETIDEK